MCESNVKNSQCFRSISFTLIVCVDHVERFQLNFRRSFVGIRIKSAVSHKIETLEKRKSISSLKNA